MSPEQLRAFLARVGDDRLYAAWLLLATTGMRSGEVAGLRWVDVDLDAGLVPPRRPRMVVNYEVVVSEPKTAKGRRSLTLDPATVAITMDTCGHALPGLDAQAAGAVARLILGEPRRGSAPMTRHGQAALGPPPGEGR